MARASRLGLLIARAVLAVWLCVAAAGAGQADGWPSRPVKLIVPFAAGGSADLLGRMFAQALSHSLGQQVYVENRGGAGGVAASAQVARAEPDGYTLVVSGVARSEEHTSELQSLRH